MEIGMRTRYFGYSGSSLWSPVSRRQRGWRTLGVAAAAAITALGATTPQSADESTVLHLYLMGHEIGRETDRLTIIDGNRRLESSFEYEDRGTPVKLTATLDADPGWAPRHLIVKGQTYRYFSADSE